MVIRTRIAHILRRLNFVVALVYVVLRNLNFRHCLV
jgi:hypothetical protein